MSYDLFVWCDPPVPDVDAALALLESACERDDLAPLDSSPRFTAFLAELFVEHPPLESVDADTSVWSFTSDRSERHALLSIQAVAAQRVHEMIMALAVKHGVRCFDPQTGELFQPDGAPNVSARAAKASGISGSTATPTDLFWLVITKFRNDRDVSGHFLGQSAARVAKALQTGIGSGAVHDVATLLFLASREDCDLDFTVTEETDGATAVVTVVSSRNTSLRRRVHMRRVGRAWKITLPTQA